MTDFRLRRDYTFSNVWEVRSDVNGHPTVYTQPFSFADRETGIRAHQGACQGRWVTALMQRPHVTPLIEHHTPDDDHRAGVSRRSAVGQVRAGRDLYDPKAARSVA